MKVLSGRILYYRTYTNSSHLTSITDSDCKVTSLVDFNYNRETSATNDYKMHLYFFS